jgi:hypothetical protein
MIDDIQKTADHQSKNHDRHIKERRHGLERLQYFHIVGGFTPRL